MTSTHQLNITVEITDNAITFAEASGPDGLSLTIGNQHTGFPIEPRRVAVFNSALVALTESWLRDIVQAGAETH